MGVGADVACREGGADLGSIEAPSRALAAFGRRGKRPLLEILDVDLA